MRRDAPKTERKVPDILDVSMPGILEQEPRGVPHLDVLEDHRSQFTGHLARTRLVAYFSAV